MHDVAPPTVPPLPTWVDRELDECSVQSESCWGEMEDRRNEEVEEWGLVPHPGAALEGREVPQMGWARAVRASLEVNQGRFAALARVDRDDEPGDAPVPMGVGEEQEEQPLQRRLLRLVHFAVLRWLT